MIARLSACHEMAGAWVMTRWKKPCGLFSTLAFGLAAACGTATSSAGSPDAGPSGSLDAGVGGDSSSQAPEAAIGDGAAPAAASADADGATADASAPDGAGDGAESPDAI